MSNEFPKDSEYTEQCGCGRIVITSRQAHTHSQHCDEMPSDSQLLGEEHTV